MTDDIVCSLSPDPSFNEAPLTIKTGDPEPVNGSTYPEGLDSEPQVKVETPSKRRRFFRSPSPAPLDQVKVKRAISEGREEPEAKLELMPPVPLRASTSTPTKRRRVLSPFQSNLEPKIVKHKSLRAEISTEKAFECPIVTEPSRIEHLGGITCKLEDKSAVRKPLFREGDESSPSEPVQHTALSNENISETKPTRPNCSSQLIDLTSSPDRPSSPDGQVDRHGLRSEQYSIPPKHDTSPTWERKYLGALMCEGYIVYSSAKLSEGEAIWLSRAAPNKHANKKKNFNAKKEDHVVQIQSKKNGTFARLSETHARWIVRLLDQNIMQFEGTLMFPPQSPRIGDTVHLYLKAYILRSAFVSSSNEMFDHINPNQLNLSPANNYFNKVEEKEDADKISRQQAVNTLLDTLNLLPIVASTVSKNLRNTDQAPGSQNTSSKSKSAASSLTIKGGILSSQSDPASEGSITQDKIDFVYQKAASHDMHLHFQSPCKSFQLNLRPYQKQGLGWLMKMEGEHEEAREEVSIHPLWEQYTFPIEDSADLVPEIADFFYYNPYMGELSLEFPRASRKCCGGILADEMGLGKTIQMAALICTSRPADHPLPNSRDSPQSRKPPQRSLDNDTESSDQSDFYPSDHEDTKSCQLKQGTFCKTRTGQFFEKSLETPMLSTLVICPLTLLDQWKSELERCHKGLTVHIHHSDSKLRCDALATYADVVLTTYGILGSEWAQIEANARRGLPPKRGLFDVEWYRIILDEGHSIKNRVTQVSKACYQLKGKRRWVLTGTPIVNRLEDLASLLHFIKLEPWGNFSFYRSFVTIPFGKKDPKALVVVQTIIESVLLRREKKMKDLDGNALVALPPKHIKLEYLELAPKEQMIYDMVYNNAKSEFLMYLGRGTVLNNVTAILANLMRLRQAVLHPMLVLNKLQDIKKDCADNEDGTNDQNIISQMLQDYKGIADDSFASSQLKQLEKRLRGEQDHGEIEASECTLCLDLMESRVYLPCMHAFCKNCILIYVEAKAGEEALCPTCEVPFRETQIVEHVMNRSKIKPPRSSSQSSISGASASELDELVDDMEHGKRKPDEFANGTPEKSLGSIDLKPPDFEINGTPDDLPVGGYLKRHDFISSTKLEALVSHLIEARNNDPGFSAVIFSQFIGFLDLIEKVLIRDKFRHVRLDGTLTVRKRKKALDEFNQPDRPCILVCSLKVAGVGLNLIKANRVFMMDTWWNEAIEDQAIDRIHRFGQTKPTYVVRFLVRKSIEDQMLALQKKKRAIINDAMGGAGSDKKSKARTLEDLESIFAR